MKQIARLTAVATFAAATIVGTTATSSPVEAALGSCTSQLTSSASGYSYCTWAPWGPLSKHRVALRCHSPWGTSVWKRGAWVNGGQVSFKTCPGGWWASRANYETY